MNDIHTTEDTSVIRLCINKGNPIIHIMNPRYIGFLIFEKIPFVISSPFSSNPFSFICEKIKRKTPVINNNKPKHLIKTGILILNGSKKHISNHENHKIPMIIYIDQTIILFSANGFLLWANILNTVRIT